MRLNCANCGAQYEVDGSAIPEGGREVKCSACGHVWFENPAAEAGSAPPLPRRPVDPQALAILREEAEREQRARNGAGGAGAAAASGPDAGPDAGPPAAGPVAEGPQTASPLRDADRDLPLRDADRDLAPREAPPEPGVEPAAQSPAGTSAGTSGAAPAGIPAEAHGAAPTAPAAGPAFARQPPAAAEPPPQEPPVAPPRPDEPPPAASADPGPAGALRPKEDVLPSAAAVAAAVVAAGAVASAGRATLPLADRPADFAKPTGSARTEGPAGPGAVPDPALATSTLSAPRPEGAERSGFGLGFVLALAGVGLLAGLYVMAPGWAENAPAAAPYLTDYVAMVDAARLWLDRTADRVMRELRGIMGAG